MESGETRNEIRRAERVWDHHNRFTELSASQREKCSFLFEDEGAERRLSWPQLRLGNIRSGEELIL